MNKYSRLVLQIIVLMTTSKCIGQQNIKYVRFNINNISTYIYNNGISDFEPGGSAGLRFPKDTKQTISFSSGVVWGGIIDEQIRVGGSVYRSGLQPGGFFEEASMEGFLNELYRVRPDYKTASLITEIEEERTTYDNIYTQYRKNWNEWPAIYGAPFQDVDENGSYDPLVDIPGIPGAAQTIWFVANDLDTDLTDSFFGSLPMGIELQVTLWGYADTTPLANMLFKKYKIINMSSNDINEMYFSIWSDFEIGNAENDFSGCDTLLNLGYIYNSKNEDEYLLTAPPAIGNCLLQGPIINGDLSDEAIFNGEIISGKKNLPIVSSHYLYPYKSNSQLYFEPVEGSYLEGALVYYNYMMGRIGDGTFYPVPDVYGGGTTRFPLSGNPVTKEGFIDGVQQTNGDRSIGIGTGPFQLSVGDTQEVIFAEIAALGETNLESITLLKEYAIYADSFFKENFRSLHQHKYTVPNESFIIYQNYPNPFTHNTAIMFTIPKTNFVTISIFNILGEKITTLIEEQMDAGFHEINLASHNYPTGIYFVTITYGNITKTIKVLVLK